MKDQHKKIKGYRDLSAEEIASMNEVKVLGKEIGDMIERARGQEGLDQRWVSIAATDFQTALMALVRSIAQPTTF